MERNDPGRCRNTVRHPRGQIERSWRSPNPRRRAETHHASSPDCPDRFASGRRGFALSGCESFDPESWFNSKKPLPGERKAMFPGGVPGVPQGVPPELTKGYQPAPDIRREVATREAPKPRLCRGSAHRSPSSRAAAPDIPPEAATQEAPAPRFVPPGASLRRSPSRLRRSGRRQVLHSSQAQSQAQEQSAPPQAAPWPPQPSSSPEQPRHSRRRRAARQPALNIHDDPLVVVAVLVRQSGACTATELHHRHHRPAQCRQVHAVQPAGRPSAWRWSTTCPASARPPRGRARLGDLDFTIIDTAGLRGCRGPKASPAA